MRFRRSVRMVVSIGVATVLAAAVLVVVGAVSASAAAARSFSASSALGSIGAFAFQTVTAPGGDFTLTVDGGVSYDPVLMQEVINEVQGENPRLSDTIKQSVVEYPLGLPGDDTSGWVDFDGTLSMDSTDTGLSITIPASEVQTSANWWQSMLAAAAGAATGYLLRGICLAAGPGAVVCTPIGGFVGGFVQGFITQAIDKTLGDPLQWGITLLKAVIAAIGGAVWEKWAKDWFTNSVPVITKSVVDWIKLQAKTSWAFMGSVLTDALSSAADFFGAVGQRFPDAVAWLTAHVASYTTALRVMPLGDSITYGTGSTTGSGYRSTLWDDLSGQGTALDFVGSQHSGTMADNDNEGHPGWTIADIAGITDSSLATYEPNVVLLHIGTNDMDRNVDPAGAPARLGSLIDQIFSDDPTVTLVVSTLIPSSNPATEARIIPYNQAIPGVVAARQNAGKHIWLVDMSSVTTADLVDTLHPNDGGYQKMGTVFYDGVVSVENAGWVAEPPSVGTGGATGGGGTPDWYPQGVFASGYGAQLTPSGQPGGTLPSGAHIQLADINGDGKGDYLQINADGSVDAWLNASTDPAGTPDWVSQGSIAPGVGAPGSEVQFADINGDGKADYVVLDSTTGSLTVWLNGGGSGTNWAWNAQGTVAPGVGAPGSEVQLADINGDGRADYLVVYPADGSVTAWFNGGADSNSGTGWDWNSAWNPQAPIAPGVGAPGSQVKFADVDGDGKADYVVIDPATGSLTVWLNGGPDANSPSGWDWNPQGQIAPGATPSAGANVQLADVNGDKKADYIAAPPGDGTIQIWINAWKPGGGNCCWNPLGTVAAGQDGRVVVADINGDKKADYLYVAATGAVYAWLNAGFNGTTWIWDYQGMVAPGVGVAGSEVQFADINGDGRADYLVVNPTSGAVSAWLNGGGSGTNWAWNPQGTIAPGVGAPGTQVQFADINGDGKADYLVVGPGNGSVTAWFNGGPDAGSSSGWDWNPQGTIADGVGAPGRQIRFASLYGSGRADYLQVQDDSSVLGWQNGGWNAAGGYWAWNPQGVIAAGVPAATGGAMSAPGSQIFFADINGDGKADYLDIDPTNGSIYAWTNSATH